MPPCQETQECRPNRPQRGVSSSGSEGGGISSSGTLTVNNSTLSGNSSSGYGGGIYNSGSLSENTAGYLGGGVKAGRNTYEVRFRLDAGKTPKKIDLFFPDPPNPDKLHRGIYQLEFARQEAERQSCLEVDTFSLESYSQVTQSVLS